MVSGTATGEPRAPAGRASPEGERQPGFQRAAAAVDLPLVGSGEFGWSTVWEDDLTPEDHASVAALLARCFPRSRTPFGGQRSWSSGRPELRIMARAAGRSVAHIGVLRRFLRVAESGSSLLVGDVGLVAVDPDVQGCGVGAELLARARRVLGELELSFGFLTCGDHVAEFYARAGWVRTPGPTRMVRADGTVQVYGGVSMVLPVRAGIADWPTGAQVDRNGLEL